ncbi:MAG: amino acid transporter [Desulfobacteraceae bacterium]|nr:amino acid transporter [Desulfobacteraceae bacterium]
MNKMMKVISSMFLVAGTCVGGGMLALPVRTGGNGFIPSFFLMIACCFLMTLTALLYLEVIVNIKDEAHVISLTEKLLGPKYKAVSWVVYLFMSYASIVAYASGGGAMVSNFFKGVFSWGISPGLGCAFFIIIFGVISCLGEKFVGKINTILVCAMIGAYFFLIGTGASEIHSEYLLLQNYTHLTSSIPVLLTIFSFQAFIIPGIGSYLEYDVKNLKIAIIGGALLTLAIYSVWQLLVLGTVPVNGPFGLLTALKNGHPATQYLEHAISNPLTTKVTLFFAFFALTTSFLGMTLGLSEFLSDGIKIPRKGFGYVLLMIIIIIPTLFFATKFERIFIIAMDATGGFGDTLLNGLLPVAFVWSLRYKLKQKSSYTVFGGKPLLVIVFLFYASFFIRELLVQTGLLH